MEKYAVLQEEPENEDEKRAEEKVCGKCGRPYEAHGRVRICPKCGSEPFEPSGGKNG